MISLDLKAYLDAQYPQMLALLEKLVTINSVSACKTGIDQIAEILQKEYEIEGFSTELLVHEGCGNALVATKPGEGDGHLLMICHMDTAYPGEFPTESPFRLDGNRAFGPGVLDMKACIVSCLYVLKGLYALHVPKLPTITVLLSGDEEAGSLAVQQRILEEGRKASWCIVTEGARENGAIVIERKGNSYFHVMAKGRSVHAGIEPQKGRNAIEELALKIVKLRELNDFEKGSTVTIGLLHGGENRITVAENAEMYIDLRYRTKEAGEQLIAQVEAILNTPEIDGVKTTYTLTRNRPPLTQVPGSELLQRLTKEASDELGIPYLTAITGGVSDGNFVADLGVPTIDGLGPVGGLMCSPEEYLLTDTLTERAARMGAVIAHLNLPMN